MISLRQSRGSMRVAALSDIHGNVWALEAALQDLGRQGVDLVVNAGDSRARSSRGRRRIV